MLSRLSGRHRCGGGASGDIVRSLFRAPVAAIPVGLAGGFAVSSSSLQVSRRLVAGAAIGSQSCRRITSVAIASARLTSWERLPSAAVAGAASHAVKHGARQLAWFSVPHPHSDDDDDDDDDDEDDNGNQTSLHTKDASDKV